MLSQPGVSLLHPEEIAAGRTRLTEEANHRDVLGEAAGVERDGDRLRMLVPGLAVANEELQYAVPQRGELEWEEDDNDDRREQLDGSEL